MGTGTDPYYVGVINAYTRASQNGGILAEAAYRFEQLGGLILKHVKT